MLSASTSPLDQEPIKDKATIFIALVIMNVATSMYINNMGFGSDPPLISLELRGP